MKAFFRVPRLLNRHHTPASFLVPLPAAGFRFPTSKSTSSLLVPTKAQNPMTLNPQPFRIVSAQDRDINELKTQVKELQKSIEDLKSKVTSEDAKKTTTKWLIDWAKDESLKMVLSKIIECGKILIMGSLFLLISEHIQDVKDDEEMEDGNKIGQKKIESEEAAAKSKEDATKSEEAAANSKNAAAKSEQSAAKA